MKFSYFKHTKTNETLDTKNIHFNDHFIVIYNVNRIKLQFDERAAGVVTN